MGPCGSYNLIFRASTVSFVVLFSHQLPWRRSSCATSLPLYLLFCPCFWAVACNSCIHDTHCSKLGAVVSDELVIVMLSLQNIYSSPLCILQLIFDFWWWYWIVGIRDVNFLPGSSGHLFTALHTQTPRFTRCPLSSFASAVSRRRVIKSSIIKGYTVFYFSFGPAVVLQSACI